MIGPSSPVLRGPRELRARVDGKLGGGSGLSMEEARAKLSPAERMEWALGECLVSMLDRRFHIWVQGWCLDRGVDGPAVVAAIGEAGRALDGVASDLFRWTALRGAWARSGERPDALVSVVPEVWLGAWDRVKAFAEAISSRWPEDLDPFALPAAPPWTRAGRSGPIRPDWGATPSYESAVETASHALWAGGASEDELDAFFRESSGAADLPAVLARWVAVDPAEQERLRAAIHPRDPVAGLFGVEKLAFPSLLRVPASREAEARGAASHYRSVSLDPAPDRSFALVMRAALRRDPDLLVARAGDVGEADVDLLMTALETGHALLLIGDGPAVPALVERAKRNGTPILG